MMTALAATVGAGNIVGVAVAIGVGGPGAILGMWLTGVFGMATKYAEAFLAVKYRVRNNKREMSGGPMFVLEHGLKMKWLAVIFAVFTGIAAFGIGNMFQAKELARERGTSINRVFVDAIESLLGLRGQPRTNGLEKFAGDSDFGTDWDTYLEDLRKIAPEDWK